MLYGAILAQSVERVAFNHVVVGSIPIDGDSCCILVNYVWITMQYRQCGFINHSIHHWHQQIKVHKVVARTCVGCVISMRFSTVTKSSHHWIRLVFYEHFSEFTPNEQCSYIIDLLVTNSY